MARMEERVRRFVRLSLVIGVAIAAMLCVEPSATSAVNSPIDLTIHLVVTGAGHASSITANCGALDESNAPAPPVTYVFSFDGQGNPTTATVESQPIGTKLSNGWAVYGGVATVAFVCHYVASDTGGAVSTAWACRYTGTPTETPRPNAGCSASSDTGTGPFDVVYASSSESDAQQSDVTFTLAFGAAAPGTPSAPKAVAAPPTFTG